MCGESAWQVAGPLDRILVAVADGEVVGNLGLHPQPNARRAHVGHIGMAVRDDWHGKGVGKALLRNAIDLADNWLDLMRLELTVWARQHRGPAPVPGSGRRERLALQPGAADEVQWQPARRHGPALDVPRPAESPRAVALAGPRPRPRARRRRPPRTVHRPRPPRRHPPRLRRRHAPRGLGPRPRPRPHAPPLARRPPRSRPRLAPRRRPRPAPGARRAAAPEAPAPERSRRRRPARRALRRAFYPMGYARARHARRRRARPPAADRPPRAGPVEDPRGRALALGALRPHPRRHHPRGPGGQPLRSLRRAPRGHRPGRAPLSPDDLARVRRAALRLLAGAHRDGSPLRAGSRRRPHAAPPNGRGSARRARSRSRPTGRRRWPWATRWSPRR